MSYTKVPSNEQSWSEILTRESLRKQAKQLEYQIDSRLIALQTNPSNTLNEELQQLLNSLTTITQEMDAYSGDPTHQHLLSRHVSNLFEYNREFAKTRQNHKALQDHQDLLQGGVHSRNTGFQQQHYRMEQAHDAVDEILMQALNSAEDMESQSRGINSMQSRVKRITNQFPLLRGILSKIKTQKQKETLILGLLIGFCSCVLLWMMFRK